MQRSKVLPICHDQYLLGAILRPRCAEGRQGETTKPFTAGWSTNALTWYPWARRARAECIADTGGDENVPIVFASWKAVPKPSAVRLGSSNGHEYPAPLPRRYSIGC
jgi:hypothetical protein